MSDDCVGYILKRFPVLSETFVLNEILELEAQGKKVHIFSLERPRDPRFHPSLPKLKAQITYLPAPMELKRYKKKFLEVRKVYSKLFWHTFRYVLRSGKPTLLIRFFQSCYIADQIERRQISHLHAHFAHRATSVTLLASKISGVPYSFTAHAVDIFKNTQCRRALAKKIDCAHSVVTVSDFNMSYLKTFTNRNHFKKVNNGIYLDQFSPPQQIKPFTPFQFICVARFVEKKGHRVLLEACSQLRDRQVSFNCLLVGKGKLQGEIEEMIRDKGLSGAIEIVGPQTQDEVLAHFHNSHALVLPCIEGGDGNKDGLPVSIVEALACGLPVITTPMTGNPEVIDDRVNGLMVPMNDPEKLALAMESLIKDQELYDRLRSQARPSVEEKFDIRQTVKNLHAVFNGD